MFKIRSYFFGLFATDRYEIVRTGTVLKLIFKCLNFFKIYHQVHLLIKFIEGYYYQTKPWPLFLFYFMLPFELASYYHFPTEFLIQPPECRTFLV